jgi:hypothetical protein
VHNKFSFFDSERASGITFNCRPPVKMVDFHCEITFISVFDGIRDIFEARFIVKFCFFNSSNIHSDVTIDRDHQEP